MKVKGWVVIEKGSGNIWYWDYIAESCKAKKRGWEELYHFKFLVKPCTITIHDKAVGK
jgi:hypothetical protein